jgi:His-Xaa-Ser system protein HxsD
MESFLKEVIDWNKFELLIDTNIFSKDIILKAAYQFLDRWYFFFKFDEDKNIILQFTKREENTENPKNIIADFSDELLAVYLRDNLEKENKDIREKIVWAAIANSLDSNNFIKLNTDNNEEQNQIDFDKDIDEILKEIENDPELKIDEEEIEKILKEIEEETENEIEAPEVKLDVDAFKDMKNKFKK